MVNKMEWVDTTPYIKGQRKDRPTRYSLQLPGCLINIQYNAYFKHYKMESNTLSSLDNIVLDAEDWDHAKARALFHLRKAVHTKIKQLNLLATTLEEFS